MDTHLRHLAQVRRSSQLENGPHLTDEQLRALRAGLLKQPPPEQAEAHLSSCGVCRDALLSVDWLLPTLSPARRADLLKAITSENNSENGIKNASASSRLFLGGVVATALLLFALRFWSTPELPSLPPYRLAMSGGVQQERGEASSPSVPLVVPTSQLVFELSPERGQVLEPPTAWLYVNTETGWQPAPQQGQQVPLRAGKLLLSIEASQLFEQHFGNICVKLLLLPPGQSPPPLLPVTANVLEQCVRFQASPTVAPAER